MCPLLSHVTHVETCAARYCGRSTKSAGGDVRQRTDTREKRAGVM